MFWKFPASWKSFQNHGALKTILRPAWVTRKMKVDPRKSVCFVLLLFCLLFCVYVLLQIHCGSAIVPGASRAPYYCAPLVRVFNFLGGLAVWRFYKQANKQGRGGDRYGQGCSEGWGWGSWILLSDKMGDWKQIGDSSVNPVIFKYCHCTTYCSTSHRRER